MLFSCFFCNSFLEGFGLEYFGHSEKEHVLNAACVSANIYLIKLGKGLNDMSAALLTLVTAVYVKPLANSFSERSMMILSSVIPWYFFLTFYILIMNSLVLTLSLVNSESPTENQGILCSWELLILCKPGGSLRSQWNKLFLVCDKWWTNVVWKVADDKIWKIVDGAVSFLVN